MRTARIATVDLAGAVEAGGVVRGRLTATVASRVQAPVVAVRVAPGDRVTAGQLLVVLDARDVEAGARQAKAMGAAAGRGLESAQAERAAADAALALAKATHQRLATLHERKSATSQEFDEAVAALRAAEARAASAAARVEEASAGLEGAKAGSDRAAVTESWSRVTAPFAGVVTEKLVEEGTLVGPGAPLVRLESEGDSVLEVRLDESRAAQVKIGDTVAVTLDVGDAPEATEGRVVELARAIDVDARAVLVKVALPKTRAVRPGTFGRARFPLGSRATLGLPSEALVRHGQLTQVFVVDGSEARLRLVSVGNAAADGALDVLAGLSAGDMVILGPPPNLRDGSPIAGAGVTATTSGGRR